MSRATRIATWFNRLLLAAGATVMSLIALRNLSHPVAAARAIDIVLASSTAVTVARVGFGGFPLGFALVLIGCLVSDRRLTTGVWMLLGIVTAVTAARVQGLLLDGATSYNLLLLRPEGAILTLSLVGLALDRRARRPVAASQS